MQLAERHTQPSEGRPAPTWPWWIKAQAAFLQGDLGKVCTGPSSLLPPVYTLELQAGLEKGVWPK